MTTHFFLICKCEPMLDTTGYGIFGHLNDDDCVDELKDRHRNEIVGDTNCTDMLAWSARVIDVMIIVELIERMLHNICSVEDLTLLALLIYVVDDGERFVVNFCPFGFYFVKITFEICKFFVQIYVFVVWTVFEWFWIYSFFAAVTLPGPLTHSFVELLFLCWGCLWVGRPVQLC